MDKLGFNIKGDSGSKRLEIGCEHQNGTLYVVRGEQNWVCSDSLLSAHALAGFLKHLVELDNQAVKNAMRDWGLYFRAGTSIPEKEQID